MREDIDFKNKNLHLKICFFDLDGENRELEKEINSG
jgi:hypothetical protein